MGGGGSQQWGKLLMTNLALCPQLERQLVLHDIDFTPDASVATASFSLPDDMKAAFEAGNTYLTFDVSDVPPAAGAAKPLDDGQYIGYLMTKKEVKERRNIRRAGSYAKPQVWS